LLNEIRLSGNWEAWLDFFAEAVIVTTTQPVDTASALGIWSVWRLYVK
jgi:hypothetical protein